MRFFRGIAPVCTNSRGKQEEGRREESRMGNTQEQRGELLERLRRLADQPVNDGVKLAFLTPETADRVEGLNLSGVTELKRTDKGVEVKFVDPIKVLEMMRELMERDGKRAEEFFRALGESAGTEAE